MAAAFSHVIFDLDGTILNTLEDLAAAGNHTCEMHGWPPFAVDEYRYKVGNGMLKLVERFMPAEYAGDSRMFEQTLAEFRAYYGEHKEDHTAPYAGTIEMLDRLRAAGVQLAVLTNKDHVSAAPLIEKYFGSERFALVQGRVDALPPKPEAPVTLHVMKELGADPATTLYVGDSNSYNIPGGSLFRAALLRMPRRLSAAGGPGPCPRRRYGYSPGSGREVGRGAAG